MSIEEWQLNKRKVGAIVMGIIILATGAIFLASSIKFVDTGYRGVLLHWQEPDGIECHEDTGECKAIKPPLGEGLHFVVPIQDDVIELEVRTQKFEKKTTSASKDLQDVSTTVAVNFKAHPSLVHLLYATVGLDYTNRIITPAVDETVKQVTARFNAEELITKREIVKDEIELALENRLAKFHLLQDSVSITEFTFTPQFTAAIDAKVTAEQNALTATNIVKIKEAEAKQQEAEALGEKLAAIQRAEGVRDAKILEANGTAAAILIEADAEKERIRLLTEFLRNNPEFVEYMRILQWNGELPQVLMNGDGATPLLQIPTRITQLPTPSGGN